MITSEMVRSSWLQLILLNPIEAVRGSLVWPTWCVSFGFKFMLNKQCHFESYMLLFAWGCICCFCLMLRPPLISWFLLSFYVFTWKDSGLKGTMHCLLLSPGYTVLFYVFNNSHFLVCPPMVGCVCLSCSTQSVPGKSFPLCTSEALPQRVYATLSL